MFKYLALLVQVMLLSLAYGMALVHGDERGAVSVKSAADASKKWGTNAAGAQSYYQAGVQGAGNKWLAETINGAGNFDAAIKSGNIKAMYTGGVKKAGAEKYQSKAVSLGAPRFSQGVTAAIPDYQTGVDPYLQTIAGLTLGARAPRGSASNLQRVSQIAAALTAKRLALRTAGA